MRITSHSQSELVPVVCCSYCKMGLYSCCDVTNPAHETELLYGQRIGGLHGVLTCNQILPVDSVT